MRFKKGDNNAVLIEVTEEQRDNITMTPEELLDKLNDLVDVGDEAGICQLVYNQKENPAVYLLMLQFVLQLRGVIPMNAQFERDEDVEHLLNSMPLGTTEH